AGPTDPAVAAGDEGDATGEPVGTDKTRRVVRRRLHLVLSAGLTLLFLRRLQALLAVSALRFPGGLAARCSIRIGHGIMLRFELPCVAIDSSQWLHGIHSVGAAALTRQTTFPTSSATSSAPALSIT